MITTCVAEFVYDLRGLSTDTKPTKNSYSPLGHAPGNGSRFIEIDTSKIYFYNETGDTWVEFSYK